jgi:GNAT superfamily N-acetyltransferase
LGRRFGLPTWGLFIARVDGQIVGGAMVAYGDPNVEMLEGRSDLAVLWDIRVVPAIREQGVGSALFQAAEAWVAERQCRELKVETQNTNVAACRFYARHGCVLRVANRGVYPPFPDEVQFLWYKDLARTNDCAERSLG